MTKTPAQAPVVSFSHSATPKKGTVIIFAAEGETPAPNDVLPVSDENVRKACEVAEFTGKFAETVEILAPAGSDLDRISVVGLGKLAELDDYGWVKLGGAVYAAARTANHVTVMADIPGIEVDAARIADLGLGVLLRAHKFDKYKTKKGESDKPKKDAKAKSITIQCADPKAAEKAYTRSEAIAGGVILARDLVNEPANVLGPVEFAAKASELKKLGVKVDILTEREMAELKMDALLGVGQGSSRPPRLAVMQWNGGKSKQKPIAFVGKGVVFDTGGISIKPAGGMEEMKGDMAGAAAVIGVMQALAARKAKANVVGIIGLVENMPDGNAQRPGDIVTSMSGQTIEIINTDAEGRLVLADALWYCRETFDPQFMVNLATLTGAVLVALGTTHAGLFSNNDAVAERLTAAGLVTGEKLWRMPLGDEYDKMIDSKFADMKNSGGRQAGSITAAQFLKRFVGDTPWAHLDVAGTAMDSPATEISDGWASGFGVRLLDRLVADHYEG